MRKQILSSEMHIRLCVLPLLIGAQLQAQAADNVHTVTPPSVRAAQRSSSVVIDVVRFVNRTNERSQLAFWRKNEAGGASRFAHLTGLTIGRRSSRRTRTISFR